MKNFIVIPFASDVLASQAVTDMIGTLQMKRGSGTRYGKSGIQGATASDFWAIGHRHGTSILTAEHGFLPTLVDGRSARVLGYRLIENPVVAVRGLARIKEKAQNVFLIERDAAYVIRALAAAGYCHDGRSHVASPEVARSYDVSSIRATVKPSRTHTEILVEAL